MSNILDYLDWRGDLSFDVSPFCEVDALILASMSYNGLEYRTAPVEGLTLRQVAPRLTLWEQTGNKYFEQWRELLYRAAESTRFGEIRVHDYETRTDEASAMQFAAVTFTLPDGTEFVSFRGTDNSLVGWREDFNMAFERVPSQTRAAEYLQRIAREHPGVPLMAAGHSKGGNLAVCAAVWAPSAVRNRLRAVWSFDGPGVDDETAAGEAFAGLLPRIRSVLPQGSVIGLLLNYIPNWETVRSTAVGILQHDAFSWQVLGTGFVREENTTASSQIVDRTVHTWLAACDMETRHRFVDTLFQIMEATGASSLHEMSASKLNATAAVISAVNKLDPESRRMMLELLGRLISAGAVSTAQQVTQSSQRNLGELQARLAQLLERPEKKDPEDPVSPGRNAEGASGKV